ncbi:MAG TPA: endonuclease/exonuclease/phosphatase family protein, partial [Draconibacterium sp.]|nr:endonuclease/exonuclease/phosphatase family protein [Draconibacterium sp.]
QEPQAKFSIMFYNTENLFDPEDAALPGDDEFTPGGDRHWTYKRLNSKLLHISKVIMAASGWQPPGIVALCEVENRSVLERLIQKTPLSSFQYQIIHKQSPDHRGIDVAMLYNTEQFYPIEYKYYPLKQSNDSVIATREILYVSGIAMGTDTLHLFVNHWPSRYSGLLETRPIRDVAARLLREKVDELFQKYKAPKIIIMGDFNDQPNDESITKFLKVKKADEAIETKSLYNLSFGWMKNETGTLKYQSQWSVFDQIIVSGALLQTETGFYARPENAQIVEKSFLLEKDERYGGVRPFRTYIGFRYHGGFSDHLPVILKFNSDN